VHHLEAVSNMATLAYPSPNSSKPEAAQDTSAVSDTDQTARPARVPPIPASVAINVEGAFIVDEPASNSNGDASEFVHYEHKDIRLPHHTAVVSHVAVDVSRAPSTSLIVLTETFPDRWLTCQTRIFLPRAWICCWWWPVELHQLRDR